MYAFALVVISQERVQEAVAFGLSLSSLVLILGFFFFLSSFSLEPPFERLFSSCHFLSCLSLTLASKLFMFSLYSGSQPYWQIQPLIARLYFQALALPSSYNSALYSGSQPYWCFRALIALPRIQVRTLTDDYGPLQPCFILRLVALMAILGSYSPTLYLGLQTYRRFRALRTLLCIQAHSLTGDSGLLQSYFLFLRVVAMEY